jgi:hypothetical protein
MQYVLAETYAAPTLALELVDPRFYHLDTCFCALSDGEVIVYRPAFAANSLGLIEELVGRNKLIVAADEDAHHLAVNSVCLGRDVVLCHASDALRGALTERGYRPHVIALDSFNRAGGAAYCLTLRLDLQTRPAAQHATHFVEEDFAEFRAAAQAARPAVSTWRRERERMSGPPRRNFLPLAPVSGLPSERSESG